jgi:hypothetical protein
MMRGESVARIRTAHAAIRRPLVRRFHFWARAFVHRWLRRPTDKHKPVAQSPQIASPKPPLSTPRGAISSPPLTASRILTTRDIR